MTKNKSLVPKMFFHDDIFDYFENFFGPIERRRSPFLDLDMEANYRSPMYHVDETDKEYLMKVEIPGVKKEDIKLNVKGAGLELIAESKIETDKEKSYSKFYFYRTLPDTIDQKQITSEYKDGVLQVKLPKLEYKSPEKLEIKVD